MIVLITRRATPGDAAPAGPDGEEAPGGAQAPAAASAAKRKTGAAKQSGDDAMTPGAEGGALEGDGLPYGGESMTKRPSIKPQTTES